MATVQRRCPKCSRRFRIQSQSPRKFCETCRPPRLKPLPEPEQEAPRLPVVGEVERSLREALDAAGRVDRYQAVLALRLARQLDSATSVAGAQGLAKQIDDLMVRALDGVDLEPPDFVDEVAERRLKASR